VRQTPLLTLTDVRQVKVLSDPLRIRILEELCTVERTTKQVAQRLGEKPTKLYHHVEALERVGLIRLARTQQNRGTIEKYYISVARQFRADSRIFSAADADPGSQAEGDALPAFIATVFDRTADEMRGLVSQNRGQEGIEEQGVLTYLEVRTDSKHGRQLQARLARLIKSLDEIPEPTKKSGERRYRLTIAFYPLDAEDS
jgi:DNA-binding transcriptional ArsR family regulator